MVQNENAKLEKPTFQSIDSAESACRGGRQALPGGAA
jgi:hypothetical protein